MTTTRIYASTDASAPVLTGAVASLLNLLDKCLVDGYGSKTAAGWTRAFVGTNITAYRNSVAAGGTGMYMRVADAGSGTGGAREALVRCYLTMSDINTGTIETPTAAHVASSIVWRKSNTVDSTARPWIVIADELTFYICIDTGTLTSPYGHGMYGAGDFQSHVPGDAYRFFIAGRESQHAASAQGTQPSMCTRSVAFATPGSFGFWLARGHNGITGPIRAALATAGDSGFTYIGTSGNIASPAPGSLLNYWQPAIIGAEASIRGLLRGLEVPLTSMAGVALGTTYVNPPGITGTLVAMRHDCHSNSMGTANDGHLCVLSDQAWPI